MYRTLLFLYTVFLLISCGYHPQETDNQNVFRFNLPAGLSSLDPAFARDQANTWMCSQIFNGLVSLDSNLNVQPSIAKNWEISDSGKVYIFHLRTNVLFHKHPALGKDSTRAVTAQDFVFSFNRIANPETGSFGQWIFNGKILTEQIRTDSFQDLPGFQAINDSTLKITLKKAFPPFISLLAMPYASVVPAEVVRSMGKSFRKAPIGTGPFYLKSWREGQSLILLKNPVYFEYDHEYQLPYLDAIRIGFSASPLTSFNQLVQGEIDFLNRPDLSLKDELFDAGGELLPKWQNQLTLIRKPQLNTEYLGIQMDTQNLPHPLSALKIRQALSYAIDRDKIVRFVLKGMGYAAHSGMVPPGMPGTDTTRLSGYTYNPERCKRLLKEAGFPDGKGLPEITLYTSPSYQPVMEMIQYQLAESGIHIKLENGEGSSLREMIYQGKIPFWRASWIADYPDPENYLALFYSPNQAPGGPNTTRFVSSVYDSLYQLSISETRDSSRFKLYNRMQQILIEESPVILLYYDRIIRLTGKKIQGLETDGMNNLILKRVRISA